MNWSRHVKLAAGQAHEEVSERVGQILKLAADEAKSEREKVSAEIAAMRESATAETEKLRADVKDETDRQRAEAQDRAERMLTAAQEQSDRAITSARAEADSLVTAAQQTAEQLVADATKHADSTVAAAIAQAKQQLDDATARATAIHEGAERRLNLLISRHTETVRRLTEIRDVVTSLVAGEAARGSLEDEVTRALAAQTGTAVPDRQSSGPHEAPHGGAHRAANRTAAGVQGGPASAVEGRRAGAAAASGHDSVGEPPAIRSSAAARQQAAPMDRDADPWAPIAATCGSPANLATPRCCRRRRHGRDPAPVRLADPLGPGHNSTGKARSPASSDCEPFWSGPGWRGPG